MFIFISLFSLSSVLSKALDSTADALAEAVALIKLSRSQDELEEAKKIALRRSGARGAEARKQLLKAEAKVLENEQRCLPILAQM